MSAHRRWRCSPPQLAASSSGLLLPPRVPQRKPAGRGFHRRIDYSSWGGDVSIQTSGVRTRWVVRWVKPGCWRRLFAGPGSRSRRRADAVAQAGYANGLGAMLAAEEGAVLFESVADDADAAVLAGRRQRMDRALEAVEGVGGPFMLT